MAIKSREELFTNIKRILGEDMGDEHIAFLEDFTDTYNDLEMKAKGDGVDWRRKYEENDKLWKQKYTDRFFAPVDKDPDPEPETTKKSYDDLFKKEG